MRRLSSLVAAHLGLSLIVLTGGSVHAQGQPKPDPVTIDTVDHVELKGTYWPSSKGKKAPVALLLHRLGGSSSEDGWKDLGNELQQAGFAVLSFDFRGHGGSVTVGAKFWDAAHNRMHLRPRPGAAPKTTISLQDLPSRYLPYLINDIAAAKRFLERRYNDSGDCNISNLVLIGAEDGATLGALWLASEAKRYRLQPFGGMKADLPESKDVIGCVWLSMSAYIGPSGKNLPVSQLLPGWLKDAGNSKESKVPMAFIYGKEDAAGDAYALRLVRTIKPMYQRGAKPVDTDALKATGDKAIDKTKLTGSKLLGNDFDTRKWITNTYLQGFVIDDKKGLQEWEKREPDKNAYIWEFPPRAIVPCNPDNFNRPSLGKLPNPVPLVPFGIR